MSEPKLIPELRAHFKALAERFGKLKTPLHAYIAGGIAVNYHTGYRMSRDVDVKWSHRVAIPPEMQLFHVQNPEDSKDIILVGFDGNFADTLGSFPPEWEEKSIEICRVGDIALHIMNPVDLAVSKVARFHERDREDIKKLASDGLIDLDRFKQRAQEALDIYIGDTTFIKYNLRDAISIIVEELDDSEPK